jgi:hypothetical protein
MDIERILTVFIFCGLLALVQGAHWRISRLEEINKDRARMEHVDKPLDIRVYNLVEGE